MYNKIYVGKITNTHGLKGEVRVISDFSQKANVFKSGNTVYIGPSNEAFIINTYRKHKQYDMLTFENIFRIDEVERLKGLSLFVDRALLNTNELIIEDLIGYDVVMNDHNYGPVYSLATNGKYHLLVIKKAGNQVMIPYLDAFISKIDRDNKTITINNWGGLL